MSKNILVEDAALALPFKPKFIPNIQKLDTIVDTLYYKYGFAKEFEFEADPRKPGYDVRKLYRPVKFMKNIPDIPRNNKMSPEYVFWQTWFHRMIHGWTAPDGRFLTGYQVFGYNFCQIPLRDTDNPSLFVWEDPLFRSNDDEIFKLIWFNRSKMLPNGSFKNARNHVEAKARGIGWSLINLIIDMYHFVIDFNRDDIARVYSDDEVIEKERLEFSEMWSRLHIIFRTYQEKGEKKGQELTVLYSNKGGDFVIGIDKGKTKLVKRKCNFDIVMSEEKAGLYKGDRKMSIEIIEAGKFKRNVLKAVIEKNERCILSSGTQWGMFKIGGTSDKITSAQSDYIDIINDHKTYNATLHLSDATVNQIGFIDYRTGESDRLSALSAALKKRKEKEGDPERIAAEIAENPLNLSELTKPSVSFAYDKFRIIEQEKYINDLGLDFHWIRGRIELEYDSDRNPTGGYEFIAAEDGNWIINDNAQPLPFDHDYIDIAAIDDRNVNYKDGVKRNQRDSKNAMIIWRRKADTALFETDVPCAIYFADQSDMLLEYDEFYKGIMLYGVKQVINEKNNIAFWMHMREKGLENALQFFDGSVGLKVTGAIKDEMTRLGQRMIAEGRLKKITARIILDSLKVWGSSDNTDIGSAYHLVLYLIKHLEALKLEPILSKSIYVLENKSKKPKVTINLGRSSTEKTSQIVRLGYRERKGLARY